MNNQDRKIYSQNTSGFWSFCKEHIQYPEITDINSRICVVPMKFFINGDNDISSIEFDEEYEGLKNRMRGVISKEPLLIKESKRLIESFQEWKPFAPFDVGHGYKREEMSVQIYFHYSLDYFTPGSQLVLNPDLKAFYAGPDQNMYEITLLNKNGCDGVVQALFIIETDGSITNFECLGADGKTNCEVGEYWLRKLGSWEAAVHQGKPVRSQLVLSIYT